MHSKLYIKIAVLLAISVLIYGFFACDLDRYFTLAVLKEETSNLQQYAQHETPLALAAYFIIYVAVTSLSLPGAAVLTLAGGALFGFWLGTLVVSFASTIGATLAFLTSRFLLRESVQRKFGAKLDRVNAGIAKEGAFYLFAMRLVPAFPFFVINLVMGLTTIKTRTFFLVSQIGMLAGTAAYVNAGLQLSRVTALSDIISLPVLISFAVLGVLPLLFKYTLNWIKKNGNKLSAAKAL